MTRSLDGVRYLLVVSQTSSHGFPSSEDYLHAMLEPKVKTQTLSMTP